MPDTEQRERERERKIDTEGWTDAELVSASAALAWEADVGPGDLPSPHGERIRLWADQGREAAKAVAAAAERDDGDDGPEVSAGVFVPERVEGVGEAIGAEIADRARTVAGIDAANLEGINGVDEEFAAEIQAKAHAAAEDLGEDPADVAVAGPGSAARGEDADS